MIGAVRATRHVHSASEQRIRFREESELAVDLAEDTEQLAKMDEFEIESVPGRGTRVTIRKWMR